MGELGKSKNWLAKHEVTIGLGVAIITFIWSIHSMDSRMVAMDTRMIAQEQRIDKLYEMFVDLLKENRKM